MRFLLYNIRYGTGGRCFRVPWSGYFRRTTTNFKEITQFIQSQDPDVVGLVEVDMGSYRSCRQNQVQVIADVLGHYHAYSSKYGDLCIANLLPIMNKQVNAFFTRGTIHNEQFHYFERGVKRLVIELELEDVTVFLVHLALGFRIRHQQLGDLYSLVKNTSKPHIVAGDFNVLWGDREIQLFLAATGLTSANSAGMPTFPSWTPKRQLDFILHSPEIRTLGFSMPHLILSDHLPLIYDFEVIR